MNDINNTIYSSGKCWKSASSRRHYSGSIIFAVFAPSQDGLISREKESWSASELHIKSRLRYDNLICFCVKIDWTEVSWSYANPCTRIDFSVGEGRNRKLCKQYTVPSAASRSPNAWSEAGKPDPTVSREDTEVKNIDVETVE